MCFHKTSQTRLTGIKSDTRLFIHFGSVKPSFHKTSQTGINSDTRRFIHFGSVKTRGFRAVARGFELGGGCGG